MRWVLIGYMFLFIHRPFEVWPVLGAIHLERIYMLGALLALAVHGGKKWVPNGQHFAFFAFALAVLVCWVASPWMAKGEGTVEDYFKVLTFYLLVILVVHDENGLRHLMFGFLVVMTVYMLHSLREYVAGRHVYRMSIKRLIGVDESMGDPNSFGATIVYSVPFVVPFWMSRPSLRMRCFLAFYVALCVVCVGLTGSRGSFISLIVCAAVIILRSRWRVPLMVLALVAAPAMWAALPPSLQNRFETIIHPEVGPKNAIASGEGRLIGLETGIELFGKYPLTGIGPGAWRPATGSPIESHNLYGQVLGEMGALGGLTFAAIVIGLLLNVRAVRQAYRRHPEWERDFVYHVASAVGLVVFLLLFEGNFGHNLFRYGWLWYGSFLVIARHCVRRRETEPALTEDGTALPGDLTFALENEVV